MNIKGYFKKSLSRKYASLLGVSIGFFLVGTAILWLSLHYFKESYSNQIELLERKEDLAQQISNSFNSAFSDARGYFAYGNEILKENAIAQEDKVQSLQQNFEKLASNEEDKQFLKRADQFREYYFKVLPKAISDYEAGHLDEVAKTANSETTANIKGFQIYSQTYINDLGKKLEDGFKRLIELQTYAQISFTVFILIILLTLLRITRIMFTRVGQPLSQLALAANDMADGKEVPISQLDIIREDEIGYLSIAFQKMVMTVQEKEQHLISQNEALINQQNELQSQQKELEETLIILKSNELKLQHRNELIDKISNSLIKQEVIDSIVINMCKIIEADCGMMVLTNDGCTASFGVSVQGQKQFKENILSGLSERFLTEHQPFMVKRKLEKRESGYHNLITYSYDLYLPVFSSNEDLVAILVFSRFGEEFRASYMSEYVALTKNIAISLEKIKIYEKSEEDRRLNQDILNTIQEGILLIDGDGNIVQVNEQFKDIFHLNQHSKTIVGLKWKEWTSLLTEEVEEKEAFFDFLQNAINTTRNKSLVQNSFIYKKSNSNKVFKVYFEGLYHGSDKVGTVLVHRDITKEFEVDQMKSEFVSTVSHELRTPLASILGFTELMLNRELKADRQQKYLTTIYNETKRLTALINDFLDVQKMEAGKQTYEKKFIELMPILENVVNTQKVNTKKHQFQLQCQGNGGLILGDRDKIEQVFTNLISNAVKYSPNGGEINIKLYQNEDRILVDIKDEGLGIPKESINMLFTKFFRIDNSDRRRIGGTGLGLAIVQEIIKAHNGEVTVRSEYGQGSTFICSFPLVPLQTETLSTGGQIEAGYQVMVVEDDATLGQLISQELKESGFQVSYFRKGEEALKALDSTIPDAIVLDILLEEDEIDGWKIMQEVKKQENLKNIPIFVSTALDEKQKGYSLGATDYLVKPYKPSQLSKAIMQTLLKMDKEGQVYIPEEDDPANNIY